MKVRLPKSDVEFQIDDEDFHVVGLTRWRVLRTNCKRYIAGMIDGKSELLHRLLMQAPEGLVVDHIDGDGLNNTRANLRVVTHQQNLWNHDLSKPAEKGGVIFRKNRWEAGMHVDGSYVRIGVYETELAAKQARDYFARRVRGECVSLHGVSTEGFDPLTMGYTARRLLASL